MKSIFDILSDVSNIPELRAIKRRGQPPKEMARSKKREPQTELEKLQAENLGPPDYEESGYNYYKLMVCNLQNYRFGFI